MRVFLLMQLCFLFLSCGSGSTSDPAYEEAWDIFAKGLAEGDFNFQIDDDTKYIDEFHSIDQENTDSLKSYATIFRSLVQSNFHFDGKKSIHDIIEEKREFDLLNKKYRSMGFEGICDMKNQYDKLGSRPKAEYLEWLKHHGLILKEFESEIIEINIKFSRVCRMTHYKEKEEGIYFD